MTTEPFTKVVVCPLCSRAVRYDPEMGSADRAVDMHSDSPECQPSNWAKVNAKPRCPVPGCKEKLVAVNIITCKLCHADVCIRHRFPSDHHCSAHTSSQTNRVSAQSTRVEGSPGVAVGSKSSQNRAQADGSAENKHNVVYRVVTSLQRLWHRRPNAGSQSESQQKGPRDRR